MTDTPMIFGQNKPVKLIDTNLFTVATGHQAQVSIFVANQDVDYDQFTIALIPFDESEQVQNYLAYNTQIIGNGILSFSGIYLNSGDMVKVSTQLGQCSFTATGIDFYNV